MAELDTLRRKRLFGDRLEPTEWDAILAALERIPELELQRDDWRVTAEEWQQRSDGMTRRYQAMKERAERVEAAARATIEAAIEMLNERWLIEKGYSWSITPGQREELTDEIVVALAAVPAEEGSSA